MPLARHNAGIIKKNIGNADYLQKRETKKTKRDTVLSGIAPQPLSREDSTPPRLLFFLLLINS